MSFSLLLTCIIGECLTLTLPQLFGGFAVCWHEPPDCEARRPTQLKLRIICLVLKFCLLVLRHCHV